MALQWIQLGHGPAGLEIPAGQHWLQCWAAPPWASRTVCLRPGGALSPWATHTVCLCFMWPRPSPHSPPASPITTLLLPQPGVFPSPPVPARPFAPRGASLPATHCMNVKWGRCSPPLLARGQWGRELPHSGLAWVQGLSCRLCEVVRGVCISSQPFLPQQLDLRPMLCPLLLPVLPLALHAPLGLGPCL